MLRVGSFYLVGGGNLVGLVRLVKLDGLEYFGVSIHEAATKQSLDCISLRVALLLARCSIPFLGCVCGRWPCLYMR